MRQGEYEPNVKERQFQGSLFDISRKMQRVTSQIYTAVGSNCPPLKCPKWRRNSSSLVLYSKIIDIYLGS